MTMKRNGIRIQRKQYFDYVPEHLNDLEVINSSLENCFVNGLPNAEISKKLFPNRENGHRKDQLQKYIGRGYQFLKFEVNSYIGNPK